MTTRSEQIFNHALRFATPFQTPLAHPWAIIPDGFSRYHGCPIYSTRFREWLAHSFHFEHDLFPGVHALNNALRMLAAHARHSEFPTSPIFTRIGFHGPRHNPQSILIHLANTAEEIVEITPSGNRLITAQSWRFLSGAATKPLPRPIATNTTLLHQLRELLNINETALHQAIVWLFAAMRPVGPYPVLSITGPTAAGKTTLARILRALIDPSAIPLLAPPKTERDLLTLALHNRVLAFDNVNTLRPTINDAIARLATGTGLAITNANTFDDPQPLPLERPIIVTASTVRKGLNIHLDTIQPANIRTETTIVEHIETAGPAILGSLCAAITQTLSNTVTAAAISHMPDVHRWTLAAAPALGLTPEQINTVLAADPLIGAVQHLLETKTEWTGTATQFQKAIGSEQCGQQLSEHLNAAPLSTFGFEFQTWMSHRTRQIRLARAPAPPVSIAAT